MTAILVGMMGLMFWALCILTIGLCFSGPLAEAAAELSACAEARLYRFRGLPKVRGCYGGLDFTLTWLPRSASLDAAVALHSPSPVQLWIYQSSPGPIFLVSRVVTADPAFDRNVFAFAKDAAAGATFLRDPRLRETIRGLLDSGFSRIEVRRHSVKAIGRGSTGSFGSFRCLLDALVSLARTTDAFHVPRAPSA